MRNGFASVALLCTVASPGVAARRAADGHLGRDARAGAFAVRAVPARPAADPGAAARRRTRTRDIVRGRPIREGMAEILPGFQTPIYGYDGRLPRARRSAPRKGREVVVRQRNALPFESNVHLHGGYVPGRARRPPDGRDRRRRLVRLPLPERAGRRDALVPRPRARRARRRRCTTGCWRCTSSRTTSRRELELPQRRVRRAAGDRRPRVQQGRLVPLRRERRPRLPRRHDPGQRRGLAAHAVERRKYRLRFLNASNARSYTLRLGNGRAMTQIAGDGGLLARPVAAHAIPLHPAERVDSCIDFSALRPRRPSSSCTTTDGEGGTGRGHALRRRARRRREEFRVPDAAAASRSRCPQPNARRRWDLAARHRRRGRSTARGFDPNRIDVAAAAAAARSSGRSSTTPTACTRCTCTASSSGCSSARAGRSHPADRLGWKDTVGVLPNETVSVLAVVRALRGPLRVPLPRARARRQGDDAADGGGP